MKATAACLCEHYISTAYHMARHNPISTKHRRRELRNNATFAERGLWSLLRRKQIDGRRFRRQHGIGPFIVDFYCPEERLIIEVDGSVHDNVPRAIYDGRCQRYLEAQGFKVLRFSNDAVLDSSEEVIDLIRDAFGWFEKP